MLLRLTCSDAQQHLMFSTLYLLQTLFSLAFQILIVLTYRSHFSSPLLDPCVLPMPYLTVFLGAPFELSFILLSTLPLSDYIEPHAFNY